MTTKRELLKLVRMFCSECMGGPRATEGIWPVGNIADIASCTAPECIWFDFRFGRDPCPNVSEKQLERLREMGYKRTKIVD